MKICIFCNDNDLINSIKFTKKRSIIKYFGGEVCLKCLEGKEIKDIQYKDTVTKYSLQKTNTHMFGKKHGK